jgi:hypothetical protein
MSGATQYTLYFGFFLKNLYALYQGTDGVWFFLLHNWIGLNPFDHVYCTTMITSEYGILLGVHIMLTPQPEAIYEQKNLTRLNSPVLLELPNEVLLVMFPCSKI